MSNLGAGYPETRKNYFNCSYNDPWTHLRLNIFPDGGIARIRVYGSIICAKNVRDIYEKIDLISRENGGVCEKYSNAHYGHPRNLIIQENGNSMADGWETARRCDRPPILNVDHRGILQVNLIIFHSVLINIKTFFSMLQFILLLFIIIDSRK